MCLFQLRFSQGILQLNNLLLRWEVSRSPSPPPQWVSSKPCYQWLCSSFVPACGVWTDYVVSIICLSFPVGSDGKESACNVGVLGSIPGLGRAPGGGHGNPFQYSNLENPHGQSSLADYSPWDSKEADMTEWLSPQHNVCLLSFLFLSHTLKLSVLGLSTCTQFSKLTIPSSSTLMCLNQWH